MPVGKVRLSPLITQERLRELLTYDPISGLFQWRVRRGGKRAGSVAGCTGGPNGSVVIRVDYVLYLAHRLAWFYTTGSWPNPEIDHKDGDEGNNVWTNLREATQAQNMQNTKHRSNNVSGYRGVSRFRDKWQASIGLNGKSFHLGYFVDPEEAHAAYLSAKARLHTFNPTVRGLEG